MLSAIPANSRRIRAGGNHTTAVDFRLIPAAEVSGGCGGSARVHFSAGGSRRHDPFRPKSTAGIDGGNGRGSHTLGWLLGWDGGRLVRWDEAWELVSANRAGDGT